MYQLRRGGLSDGAGRVSDNTMISQSNEIKLHLHYCHYTHATRVDPLSDDGSKMSLQTSKTDYEQTTNLLKEI
jgi:hypothetical protein